METPTVGAGLRAGIDCELQLCCDEGRLQRRFNDSHIIKRLLGHVPPDVLQIYARRSRVEGFANRLCNGEKYENIRVLCP